MVSEKITLFGGLKLALRLWKLVLALWFVQLLLLMPVMLIVDNVMAPAVKNLPAAGIADADLLLIVYQVFDEIHSPAALMLLIAVVLGWLWTVIWHGGVVSWRLWADSDGESIAQIVGLGLVSFWKYFRLSLASNALVFASLILVWWPLWKLTVFSYKAGQEERMMQAIGFGMILTVLVIWVCRAAALRASWILGRHDRRSASLALVDGIVGTCAHPLLSLGTVALWSVLALGAGAVPLFAGALIPALRIGVSAQMLSHLAALAAAFFWVTLMTSFAPASGLLKSTE